MKANKRDSNMELLRVVAMLLVMVVHANFRALPVPSVIEAHVMPVSTALRFFTESLAIIAVNVFVLLSGWYGIKPRLSRLGELLFQILFFTLLIVAGCALLAPAQLLPSSLAWQRALMAGEWDYWFVKSYLMLYLLSPMLNAFVKSATRRQFGLVLIGFFVMQTAYGWWYNDAATWFKCGYSPVSFAGLYLLARYVRLYPCRIWSLPKWVDVMIYLAFAVLLTAAACLLRYHGERIGHLFMYSNPVVIVMSLHFVLFFSKLNFSSRVINWLGCSAFAIYLVHSSSYISTRFYDKIILNWFNNEPRFEFIIYSATFIAVVFIVSILLDKARIALWHLAMRLWHKIFKCETKQIN